MADTRRIVGHEGDEDGAGDSDIQHLRPVDAHPELTEVPAAAVEHYLPAGGVPEEPEETQSR